MSSYTISVTGNTSLLKCSLFPSLDLKENYQWEAALLDFTTFNSIPNVIENFNNKLHYYTDKTLTKMETVSLETGSYEIDDISIYLQEKLGKDAIKLKANNNLLRCELLCKYTVDFSKDHSIGSLLGFSTLGPEAVKKPATLHVSDKTVNIIKVNVININCNIVQGAYDNGVNGHIIHSFFPTVPPGFKIIEKPHNLVYLPVNYNHITDIVLSITDQDGDEVDFRGEDITVRIHIRSR